MATGIRLAIGAALAVTGLLLVLFPTLAYDPGPAASSYAAIERRIWWGGLYGLGILLITQRQLGPWRYTAVASVFWVVGGFLVARAVGLALDGMDSTLQWIWVAVEVVIMAVAGWLMRRWRPGAVKQEAPVE